MCILPDPSRVPRLTPALPQLPKLGFQRLPGRLFFPQTVLRLPQLAFGLLQTICGLFQTSFRFTVGPQVVPTH